MSKRLDLTGQKFGSLTVISFHGILGTGHKRRSAFNCICDCGAEKVVLGWLLKYRKTLSCGCTRGLKNIKHGFSKKHKQHRLYRIWSGMKTRCYNRNINYFHNYGGRGITMAKSWHKFENFKSDMYQSYLDHVKIHGEKQTTLDRKNNNGNYCKSNCRWATKKQQANNTRKII